MIWDRTCFMLSSSPLISVIVPLYNQQRYIGKCLRSILGQTYRNLEVIVVNDGSTDNSQEIVLRYANRDKRIRVITQANSGVATARKNGYLKATGEWIVFVDSDDYLPVDSIESLLTVAWSKDVDIVCGDSYRKWGPYERYMHAFPRSMGMQTITMPELFDSYYVSFFGINLFPVTVWGKFYRKSVIDHAMESVDLFVTPPLHRSEDEAFTMLLFPFLSSVYCLEKAIYIYRFGGVTTGNKWFTDLIDFGDFRLGLLDRYKYENGYSPLFIEYVNILITHVQQNLEFKKWSMDDAKQWLTVELGSRYLMQRMHDYYVGKTVIPDKCRMAMNNDVHGIVGFAESRLNQQRLRSFLKRLYLWFSRLIVR